MNIGHGVDSGSQRPLTGTFPCRVLNFSSQKRRASGPTTIMPHELLAEVQRLHGKARADLRTFSAIDGPA